MDKLYSTFLIGVALLAMPFCKLHSETIFKTLNINKGEFISVKDSTFPALAYNETTLFSQNGSLLNLKVNDKLILTVRNNDDAPHSFIIKHTAINFGSILPRQEKTETIDFTKEGAFIYYDNVDYPKNTYLGLSGLITVTNPGNAKNFYWNLKEHQTLYNKSLTQNIKVDWNIYDPEFFTINGNSFPDIHNDTLARIVGKVGDTIKIYIANTGQSSHSLHFHGYHLEILASSKDSTQHGWIKDSFPLKSMETMILLLIPDKVGEYSVHDHNLLAMSGAQHHPFGMVMTMLID